MIPGALAAGRRLALPMVILASAPGTAAPALDDLAFMAGCFRGPAGDGTILEERYSPPRDGMMLGTSQYTEGGRTVFFELGRIEARDGKVTLWPQPAGKPSVGFTLVSVKDGTATFENLEHDFPKRIVYRRTPEGVAVHLEGDEGGKPKSADLVMTRIPCEEPPAAGPTQEDGPR